MIIPVLPQTPLNYSYLQSGATEDVIVADNIPVPNARTIALSVRIHHLTLSSGSSFKFLIYGVDPSRTDGTVFITSASIGDTGTITSSTPNLIGLSAIIGDPSYPFVRVVLRATGPTATGTTYAELSADLIVRQAAPAMNGYSPREAAFCGDMLRLLYEETPRSRGTLSEFSIRSTPSSSEYCGKPQFPETNWPSKPGTPCDPLPHTTGLICKIIDSGKEHSIYKCP